MEVSTIPSIITKMKQKRKSRSGRSSFDEYRVTCPVCITQKEVTSNEEAKKSLKLHLDEEHQSERVYWLDRVTVDTIMEIEHYSVKCPECDTTFGSSQIKSAVDAARFHYGKKHS